MGFTLSGSTITQSGTDTGYAGLNGIAGVTRLATGDGYLYYMPTLVLSVTGTLTVADPSKDTVICARFSITGTGNFTSGAFASDGVTPLKSGRHFSAIFKSTGFVGDAFGSASYEVANGGHSTMIGGYYEAADNMHIANTAVIREYGVDVVALSLNPSGSIASNSIRIRAYGSDVIKRNCRHFDIGYDLFRMPTEFSVKAFGSVYVSQYVGGAYSGGIHALFKASALSNADGTQDFDNWGAGWVELYNCVKGANLIVGNSDAKATHCVPLFQDINFKVTNLAGLVQQNARFRCVDASVSNAPTTTITTNGGLKTWDFRNAQVYTGTTNASGVATSSPVLKVWYGSSNIHNLRFPNSTATYRFCAYNLKQQDVSIVLGSDIAIAQPIAMTQVNFLTITEAQALALTGITLTPSGTTGGSITLTSAKTVAEVWQYYRAWISQFANFGSDDTWSYDGANLNVGAWTLVGAEFLTGKIATVSATANGALANISISGNVSQSTPTDLSNVVIGGNLAYNTNTDIVVTLTNCTISGTVSNAGTGNVKLNLVNSSISTGARVVAQYPITVTDAGNNLISTQIWVFNSLGSIVEDTGFQSLIASKTIYMPVGGSLRVYSQSYGYQSKITNTAATNASLVITHIPETLVDTTLDATTRNTVAGYFSSVVESTLLYVEVNTDLVNYTPAEVLNAMHYFIVSNGGNFAALSLLANTVGSVQLIDGGFRVYTAAFKGRAKSTLNSTNTPTLFITLPLYIEDASGVSGNQVIVRNANGIDVHSALWSKATANISQNDMDSIANTTWSHGTRTLNDVYFD
jgi:hypothetical protein